MTQSQLLPSNFDEFLDARKEGFIAAKDFTENGGRIAGCLCSYTNPNAYCGLYRNVIEHVRMLSECRHSYIL